MLHIIIKTDDEQVIKNLHNLYVKHDVNDVFSFRFRYTGDEVEVTERFDCTTKEHYNEAVAKIVETLRKN